MRLFIAEKPSLARAIADALPGAPQRRDGYFQCGPGDQVAWCAGHILELASPDAYDPKFKQWRIEHLPIAPDEWKLAVSAPELLKTIKALLARAVRVVNAGDPDREGQLLVDEVLAYLGYRGPVDRVLISDLNLPAVRKAIETIQPNAEFRTLYDAALGRQRADWLYGLNMTRLFTILGRASGHEGVLSVGRVQTPLLGLIVRRDLEIEQFVPQAYFTIVADVVADDRQFAAVWQPSADDESALDAEGRLVSASKATEVERRTSGQAGTLTNTARERKSEPPPLPYSLAELQVDAGRVLGLSPKKTLDVCQNLYEKHRLITYPRSDCSYLPEGHLVQAPEVFRAIGAVDSDLERIAASAHPGLRSRAWNDAKVTAHHALVPTPHRGGGGSVAADERNVYGLVARRYLMQFFPAFEYEQIQIEIEIVGERFVADGRTTLAVGWHRAVQPVDGGRRDVEEGDGADRDEPVRDSLLPILKPRQAVMARGVKAVGRKTKPPRRFTASGLIQAMTGIARYVADPQIKQLLREADGIGTPATQASIIQTLFDRGYIEENKRQIRSTPTGRALIRALPDVATKPDMTALWEATLRKIQEGHVSLDSFINAIRGQVRDLVALGARAGALDLGAETRPCPSPGRSVHRRPRRANH